MSSIYLFQRALRLEDNLGLIECLKKSKKVYPIFCVDPRQATPKKNDFFSPFALGFMLQSLEDLDNQLKKYNSKLILLYGEPHKILKNFIEKYNVDQIFINEDYTPFAKKRTKELENICDVVKVQDYLLFNPGEITASNGKAYRVYTPFMRIVESKKIPFPKKIKNTNKLSKINLQDKKAWNILKNNSKFAPDYIPGGRTEALKRLNNINKTQKYYAECRDYLNYKTSNLSAYIKFGCISIREAWKGFGKIRNKSSSQSLRRQLIWREFYYQYYNDFPELLEWNKNPKEVKLDKKSPDIVKACFNQLDKTGWLHNRGRMILANYLLHNKKKYWKSCDKLYARRLVDYDPIVNIGNWLWIKKQPSFRWLKPDVQYEKWDRGCPKIKDDIEPGTYTKTYL